MLLPSRLAFRRWAAAGSASSTARTPVGRHWRPAGARVLACALLAIIAFGVGCPALAQPRSGGQVGYFMDFRSRPGYLFGHTFIVYGRLDQRGRPLDTHLAGIYPIDGQAGLIVGSLVPVQASVRGVKDDFAERPTNIYRKRLNPSQYARLVRVVGGLRRSEREWDLLFKNCNDFAIAVAKGMDMTTPPSWLLPYYFVGGMRLLNSP